MTTPRLLGLAAAFALIGSAPALAAAAPAPKKSAPAPLAVTPSPARTTDHVGFIIGPDYTYAPELTRRDGVPRGTVHEFTLNSADSTLYPGIAKTQPGTVPYQRAVAVYLPSGYVPGTAAPFIVAMDGVRTYGKILPPILDNLIHGPRIAHSPIATLPTQCNRPIVQATFRSGLLRSAPPPPPPEPTAPPENPAALFVQK